MGLSLKLKIHVGNINTRCKRNSKTLEFFFLNSREILKMMGKLQISQDGSGKVRLSKDDWEDSRHIMEQ